MIHDLAGPYSSMSATEAILDRHCNVIHGVWLDDADVSAIAEAGSVIAHNPVCNLRLGSGIMPFRRIRDSGIPVCLGTDEALADDSINLWTTMKIAGLIHNITDPEYGNWPAADEIIDCVFRGGARAMGREDQIGAFASGYQADIALLDLNEIAFTPLNDVQRQLVYCENGSSVRMTIVDGRILVRDGRVCSVDEEAIKREAREFALASADDLARSTETTRGIEPHYREMYLRSAATEVGMKSVGRMHARESDRRGRRCLLPDERIPCVSSPDRGCGVRSPGDARLKHRLFESPRGFPFARRPACSAAGNRRYRRT